MRRQSWGLRDDGGDGPTAIEATPWTRVNSIQCVDLSVQLYIPLSQKFYFTRYNNITSKFQHLKMNEKKILFLHLKFNILQGYHSYFCVVSICIVMISVHVRLLTIFCIKFVHLQFLNKM